MDVAAQGGCLGTALAVMELVQALTQARWPDDSALTTLPHVDDAAAARLAADGQTGLLQLLCALAASDDGAQGGGGRARGGAAAAARAALTAAVGGGAAAEEALAAAARLPIVDVSWTVRRAAGCGASGGWTLEVVLRRRSCCGAGNRGGTQGKQEKRGGSGGVAVGVAPRALAPHFPKVKEEGWWLMAADTAAGELLALRRVALRGDSATTARLALQDGSSSSSSSGGSCQLLLVSDCYLGLDQQYDVVLQDGSAGGGGGTARPRQPR